MMKASMDVYLAAFTCPAGTAAMFAPKNTMEIYVYIRAILNTTMTHYDPL